MRLSKLFSKTRKEVPADETSRNAQLLIRAGFIHKEMAGVYALLPLGLKVFEKIKNIIQEEMEKLGAQAIAMTTLQSKELWQKTDRWDDKKVDIWFKSRLQSGQAVGLAWSHEESITKMMTEYVSSYRDLPLYVYQFQTKLRNELRAKSGVMRTREFVMKDMYSYSKDEAEHQQFYNRATEAYHAVFRRVGLAQDTFFTFASGGAFTQFSHEFQTVTEAGEDTIYLDRTKKIAINEEVYNERILKELGLKAGELEKVAAAEVGNIFSFGGSKSEQLGLMFTDENGTARPVILGSYGIGLGRLMGVIVEHFADEKGIVWPLEVAPAKVYLALLGEDSKTTKVADEIYENLIENGVEVVYDDRGLNAGQKFADADLMGIPYRLVVSDKTVDSGKHELKGRTSERAEFLSSKEVITKLLA